ncbi:replication protein RepA [Rubrivivax gelatinosus]|uniref:replication protein RepA n=1 Tax=Rubrivivax gelatinosus TaxID=28068 RepID=UPI0005C19929|nr:replication protein RepA [Rubrivivax gelatinosus]MBG6083223.1 hypothetical protein [Rubrivivax gelatinosus]
MSAANTIVKMTDARLEKFQRLSREAQDIEAEDARRIGEVGYLSSTMVQVTLPYREPKGNPPAWGRTNGRCSLTIQPGHYIDQQEIKDARGRTRYKQVPISIGYPYGSVPRLLLAWVGREVTRRREREIVLGRTLTEFMTDLGISYVSGGKRGSLSIVKEQTRRLFSATIALVDNPDTVDWSTEGFKLADSLNVWWDAQAPTQGGLFDSKVVLSERFFQEMLRSPVPLDMRALRALRASPFALDVYCWLTYRSFSVTRRTEVPWEALQTQFGTETQNERKFRSLFRRALKDVQVVYPQALFDADSSSAFVLLPGTRTSVRSAAKE